MGGSMGMYVGNAIIAAAEEAVKLRRPLIIFSLLAAPVCRKVSFR